MSVAIPQSGVLIPIPETFDLEAVAAVDEAVRAAPPEAEVTLDFGAVTSCQALVLATLLTRLAALHRASPVRLAHLNRYQQTLLAHLQRTPRGARAGFTVEESS